MLLGLLMVRYSAANFSLAAPQVCPLLLEIQGVRMEKGAQPGPRKRPKVGWGLFKKQPSNLGQWGGFYHGSMAL